MSTELLARDLMNAPVVTALPTATVAEAAQLMIDRGVGSLVIVDDRGSLLGIVTKTDIVREVVVRGLPRSTQVGAIMTRNPYYVMDTATVREAAELMGSKNIGHLPVLDSSYRLVGMISRRDILRMFPHLVTVLYMMESLRRP